MNDDFSAFALTLTLRGKIRNLSGPFCTRVDDSYEEVTREEDVNKFLFTEFNSALKGRYFEHAHQDLNKHFSIRPACAYCGCTTLEASAISGIQSRVPQQLSPFETNCQDQKCVFGRSNGHPSTHIPPALHEITAILFNT